MRDRCRSLDGFQHPADHVHDVASSSESFQSCSNIHRKEYPIPWLEALFLPEFPSRSSITEKNFVVTANGTSGLTPVIRKLLPNILNNVFWQISNEIGSGSFGRVYRAVAKNDARGVYALKIQQKSLVLGKAAVRQVRREVAVQRLLSPHVFIARLYASWQNRSKLFTVLQYPIGGIGDMFALWKEHGTLSEPTVRIYGAELACALDFLHRSDVIYRDLKLENIVLDSSGHIRVVDFGLSKQLKGTSELFHNFLKFHPFWVNLYLKVDLLQYMSPEVASEQPYTHSVDWWSLAVVLHILTTGKYPYPNANATHHCHLRFVDYSTPVNCSKPLGDLFNQVFIDCLAARSTAFRHHRMLAFPNIRRLQSFEDLCKHEFFKSIDFADVEALKFDEFNYFNDKI
ncbi:unnamed protein product [Nippostrongylus brasiliensis]|uniref:Putative serine/threonine-protein kinase (inferred by orthology to a C. elegans protein) n=1 Tax=Nippostrongylus brasiliensis TaxID=27835 RepID=A0A0N4Y1A6_NIPBR|nr:unnamed protein product [Nippostrongylus brasiliensis]